MVLDSLGFCIFTGRVTLGDDAIIEGIIRAFYGQDVSFDDLRDRAKKTLRTEREFNKKAGIGEEQDTLPGFMKEEKLSPHDSVFDVGSGELESFYRTI
jgi:aldehyde:ferredoxin oxidoreductase